MGWDWYGSAGVEERVCMEIESKQTAEGRSSLFIPTPPQTSRSAIPRKKKEPARGSEDVTNRFLRRGNLRYRPRVSPILRSRSKQVRSSTLSGHPILIHWKRMALCVRGQSIHLTCSAVACDWFPCLDDVGACIHVERVACRWP